MNQLTTSETQIATHSILTSNHGKKTSAIAMDVDDDGQRIADRIQDKDIMDTTLDNPQPAPSIVADPEVQAQDQSAPEAQSIPLREDSKEKDEGAQQPSKQMRKTPHRLCLTLFLKSAG